MKKLIALAVTIAILLCVCTVSFAQTSTLPSLVLGILQQNFTDGDGISYEFSYDESSEIYYMYITIDGVAATASLASEGNEYADRWNTLCDTAISINTTLTESINSLADSDSATVSTNVRNDMNPDKIVLSVMYSVVVYDIVNDIDLLSAFSD